jgi:hypothetical protein
LFANEKVSVPIVGSSFDSISHEITIEGSAWSLHQLQWFHSLSANQDLYFSSGARRILWIRRTGTFAGDRLSVFYLCSLFWTCLSAPYRSTTYLLKFRSEDRLNVFVGIVRM